MEKIRNDFEFYNKETFSRYNDLKNNFNSDSNETNKEELESFEESNRFLLEEKKVIDAYFSN